MKILITNHKDQACGVYQYGKRFASILVSSEDPAFKYFYCELSSKQELKFIIEQTRPDIVIHNYLGMTMPWFDNDCLNYIVMSGAKQGLIVHNIGYAPCFDFFLHQHPDYPENGDNYPIPRPLFNAPDNLAYPQNKIPTIGTFGFGFSIKKYEEIARLVNEQFEEAEIKLHLTESKFCPNAGELVEIRRLCESEVTKPKIKLSITNDFKTDEEILQFLAGNDLNIFTYQKYNHYNGISSVIDYALSVKRPIAISDSNMFAHINYVDPSICVEKNTLQTIINNGCGVLDRFHSRWSHEEFSKSINKTLTKISNA